MEDRCFNTMWRFDAGAMAFAGSAFPALAVLAVCDVGTATKTIRDTSILPIPERQ